MGPLLIALVAATQAQGVSPELAYTADAFVAASGEGAGRATLLGNLDLTVTLDPSALLPAWRGARVFLYGLGTHGGSASALAGDAQGVSNIEAPAGVRLYEAWVQQSVAGGRVSVLAGRYDLNSEFDRSDAAGLFIHSSQGIGAAWGLSGRNGPSIFPATALGGRAKARLGPIVMQGAVLDGVPGDLPSLGPGTADGLLLAAEVAAHRFQPEDPSGAVRERARRIRIGRRAQTPYDRKLALGGWRYTGDFVALGETGPAGGAAIRRGSHGAYLLAEAAIRGWAGFLRLSASDPATSRFALFAGAGIVHEPFARTRHGDRLGLAIAVARNGEPYLNERRAAGRAVDAQEVAIELTYQLVLGDRLSLQPDLQLVIAPDTERARPHAWLFGVRAQATL